MQQALSATVDTMHGVVGKLSRQQRGVVGKLSRQQRGVVGYNNWTLKLSQQQALSATVDTMHGVVGASSKQQALNNYGCNACS